MSGISKMGKSLSTASAERFFNIPSQIDDPRIIVYNYPLWMI